MGRAACTAPPLGAPTRGVLDTATLLPRDRGRVILLVRAARGRGDLADDPGRVRLLRRLLGAVAGGQGSAPTSAACAGSDGALVPSRLWWEMGRRSLRLAQRAMTG